MRAGRGTLDWLLLRCLNVVLYSACSKCCQISASAAVILITEYLSLIFHFSLHIVHTKAMANPQKRQKTLLGYFTLSVPSKSIQRPVGSQANITQARPDLSEATTAGPERAQGKIQKAVASDTAAQGHSMCIRPSVVQTDSKADMSPMSKQTFADISLPGNMMAEGTSTSSSDCSASISGLLPTEADSTASGRDPQQLATNQYEQQV